MNANPNPDFEKARMKRDAEILRQAGLGSVQAMLALTRGGYCPACEGSGYHQVVGFENAIIEEDCLDCLGTGYDLTGIYEPARYEHFQRAWERRCAQAWGGL